MEVHTVPFYRKKPVVISAVNPADAAVQEARQRVFAARAERATSTNCPSAAL